MTTERAMVKKDEDTQSLQDLSKEIENSSDFVKALRGSDKKLFNNILKRLRDDTNGEFTQTEYEGIAKMTLFCDRVETFMDSNGVENVETNLLDLYRKMKTQIVTFMRDYSDGKRITPPSIKQINVYFDQHGDFAKEIGEAEFVETDAVIIEDVKDADAIQTVENRADEEDSRKFDDEDST